ncbi:MAG: cold shock domain-containing protein [Actinobacteria bacterium]|nr:cold shock domain-containing protein [Actinomycetota bacterium]
MNGEVDLDWAALWPPTRQGVVDDFSDFRGLGQLTDADGRHFFFHCIAISDGTRTIAPGTQVTFVVQPGPTGRLEAQTVTKMSGVR